MAHVDPRERYDELHVTESDERLDPAEFRDARESEAATIGWVVLGHVFDDAGRILLIQQPWADGWLAPGGVPTPDESLADAVTREVREETGVEVTPVRPHAVDLFTFENELTGETDGWHTVVFEATADTTEIARDPAVDDEEIPAAGWFDDLPENVFHPEFTRTVYERCIENRRSG